MGDSATASDPTVLETFGKWVWKWLRRLVMFPAVQVVAVVLSWAGMFAACVSISRGNVDYGFLLAVVATSLHALPPRTRRPFFQIIPFLLIHSSWGIFFKATGADSATAVITHQVLGILQLAVFIGWSLYLDWYRFRHPYKEPPVE